APPYSTAIDPLQSAAHIISEKRCGRTKSISAEAVAQHLANCEELLLLDVRTPEEHAEEWIDGSRLLPLSQLRQQLGSLPRQIPIVTFCQFGLRGFEAAQILAAAGFDQVCFMEGGIHLWPLPLRFRAPINVP
ncbi:MAG TPA: rhodanese-like domain-containing protein, partial [Geobacterales bacterium]|nr:rhodanese-like domain-containing protein [Geobacterales bacterium]